MKFVYIWATLPLVLDTPIIHFLNIRYVTLVNIVLILITLGLLIKQIMSFIEIQ